MCTLEILVIIVKFRKVRIHIGILIGFGIEMSGGMVLKNLGGILRFWWFFIKIVLVLSEGESFRILTLFDQDVSV